MDDILNNLFEKLQFSLNEKIKYGDLILFENGDVDVLSTLISIKKTEKDFFEIMVNGSISIDELNYKYDKKEILNCFENNLILRGNSIKNDRVFITHNGLFEIYKHNNFNINNVFKELDNVKFNNEEITLKIQEKVWCVFLIICGADSKENAFDSSKLSQNNLNSYHELLKEIEKEFNDKKIPLGKSINWKTGKEQTFRGFITTNKNLPKTQLYFDKPRYCYYLDLSKRKNAKYLLNLILSDFKDEVRVFANQAFYEVLKELEFKLLTQYGEGRNSNNINNFILDELTR